MSQALFQLVPVTASMQAEILAQAAIPEHVLPLMTAISGGQPYLADEHLVLIGEGWATLIGYPLQGEFSLERLMAVIDALRNWETISVLNFITPDISQALLDQCLTHEEDQYLVLTLESFRMSGKLRRAVRKGETGVCVSKTHAFRREHQQLVDELAVRVDLPPMIAALYQAMPRYLRRVREAWILEGRDPGGNLAAFFIVDGAAPSFDTYLLGAHSQVHEVPYASDVLFKTMIDQALTRGKESLQLGLGVNPGIRRFKEKWGGRAGLPYHACSIELQPPAPTSFLDALLERIP